MQAAKPFVILAIAISLAGCGTAAQSGGPPAATDGTPAPVVGASASPIPTAASAELEQLIVQVMSAPVDVSQPGPGLDRSEQDLKDFMRQTGGVAELLGKDGAAILAEIDTAEKQAVAALVAQLAPPAATSTPTASAGASAGGAAIGATPAPTAIEAGPAAVRFASMVLPAGAAPPYPAAGFEAFGTVTGLTLTGPDLFARADRDENGNAVLPTVTKDTTGDHGLKVHLTMSPTLTGSKLTAAVEMTIDVPGPPAYKETAKGTMTVQLCPDVSGTVVLEVTLGGGFSLLGGGMQYQVAIRATGHVADSGRLAGFDVRSDGSLAVQPMPDHAGALGATPRYIQMGVDYKVGADGASPTDLAVRVARWSSEVDQQFAQTALAMIRNMGHLASLFGLWAAERLWTDGYCVAITVSGMEGFTSITNPAPGSQGLSIDVPSKRVDLGSENPFTASVSHKFEGGQLRAPVTATLLSGAVSVAPSGGVPAPATFRYKAPDEAYKNALIQLGTSSKRGIAKLLVLFWTVPQGWIYAPGSTLADGLYCDSGFGGDWVVNIHWNANGITMTGKYVVTIGWDTMDGTYTYDAVQTDGETTGTWHGWGDASIALQPDGLLSMSFDGGLTKITVKSPGGTASTTVPGPEGQMFLWQPAGRACW